MNNGPVFIVDDDEDDQEILQQVWKELGLQNPLVFFGDGEKVLEHLKEDLTVPFLILCDVNIPKMDGFELKKRIQEDPSMRYKSIPFVFWSGKASNEQIKKAYDLGGNGFFIKEITYEKQKQDLKDILAYWFKSKSPE